MKNIMALGLDYRGNAIVPTMDEQLIASSLISSLASNIRSIRALTQVTTHGMAFKSEVRRLTIDPGDPKAAGWTFLVHDKDPKRKDLEFIIRRLAEHRNMAEPEQPLLYHGEQPEMWFNWLTDNYTSLQLLGKKVPQYILLLGGPDQIPFGFQSMLSTVAKVGRVCFTSKSGLIDLEAYVDKLIRLETAANPVVSRDVLFFAPDGGIQDPTFYSCRYMAEPISARVQALHFGVRKLLAFEATKQRLVDTLADSRAALIFSASHGLGAIEKEHAFQQTYNGAICCQRARPGPLTMNDLYSAEDVPGTEPFLEGAILFSIRLLWFWNSK